MKLLVDDLSAIITLRCVLIVICLACDKTKLSVGNNSNSVLVGAKLKLRSMGFISLKNLAFCQNKLIISKKVFLSVKFEIRKLLGISHIKRQSSN